MNESILFAIWLNDNCDILYNCYRCFIDDKLYYTDSLSDLNKLYDLFINSDYYKRSL
jgi:hypothetical protein